MNCTVNQRSTTFKKLLAKIPVPFFLSCLDKVKIRTDHHKGVRNRVVELMLHACVYVYVCVCACVNVLGVIVSPY